MASMPGAEIERKVRQLDNDVTDIYSMLSSIQAVQQRQGHRLDEIDRKLHEHDARFDACLLYTSPSPRDRTRSRMPSSA